MIDRARYQPMIPLDHSRYPSTTSTTLSLDCTYTTRMKELRPKSYFLQNQSDPAVLPSHLPLSFSILHSSPPVPIARVELISRTVLAYRVTRCLFQWAVVALAGTKINLLDHRIIWTRKLTSILVWKIG
ncbi:histone deacetylase phd1 [Pseudozyma hubeiensis SY62]|uniref:Histone deacetylase phd1 n=1 Tax=Pseudozyma hubeiensis (strain SY62) TaxID=1305764 RepID=R9PDT4_PSEHS|nr:histone deacetylase phd1 [Pseudozyma hubeiensis SY62]GAC99516.1 histone deacetylase phd1 [Pseudozyma hubeiensis SY62]